MEKTKPSYPVVPPPAIHLITTLGIKNKIHKLKDSAKFLTTIKKT